MRIFNYELASKLMHERGVGVIVASTKPNIEYLTGFEWARWLDKTNFMTEDGVSFVVSFAGIAQDEAQGAFYVAPSTETGYPENYNCWIKDVRYWGPVFHVEGRADQMDTVPDPVVRLAEVLKEKGLDRCKIGIEWRQFEMIYAEKLRELLPVATLVDATPIFTELRMFKSVEEIRRIRRAAAITSDVMDWVYRNAREGMTERELDQCLDVEFARRGSRHMWTDIAFGPKGANFVGPTETRLERTHILRLDIGGWCDGYVADMSRSLAWGGAPSNQARRAHKAVLRINRELAAAVRPGAIPAELYQMCMRIFGEEGYESLTRQAGHSLGKTAHEPPFLVPGNHRPLESVMIVVIEPAMRIQGVGSVNIEDTTLVTEDGCEILTTTPREIDAYLH